MWGMSKRIKSIVDITLLKFILVGIVNTLFGTTIMFGLYNLFHCSYWSSSAANYICGSVLSYFLNKHFTFHNHSKGYGVVLKFVLNIIVCYGLAYGIAKPAVRLLLDDAGIQIRDNVSMAVGMVLFICFNYLGQRFFAFKESKDRGKR